MASLPIAAGLKSSYVALKNGGTLKPGVIYICTDTGEQFLGAIPLGVSSENLDELASRVESLENLGHWVGTFDTAAEMVGHEYRAGSVTLNDFANVRQDEAHEGATTRYIVTAITEGFTDGMVVCDYEYDLTYEKDITGKADRVSGATAGNFAGVDANGNLTDSGKSPADLDVKLDKQAAVIANIDVLDYILSLPAGFFAFTTNSGITNGYDYTTYHGQKRQVEFNSDFTTVIAITNGSGVYVNDWDGEKWRGWQEIAKVVNVVDLNSDQTVTGAKIFAAGSIRTNEIRAADDEHPIFYCSTSDRSIYIGDQNGPVYLYAAPNSAIYASANLDMDGYGIKFLTDPTDEEDAANKRYVDTALNTWMPLSFTPGSGFANTGINLAYNAALRQYSVDLQGLEIPANTAAGLMGTIGWATGYAPSIAKRIVVAGDVINASGNAIERVAVMVEFNVDGRLTFYPLSATVSGAAWSNRVKLYGDGVIRFD